MTLSATNLQPGTYQYTYPTFVDRPQLICVHFLTPDHQQAFVSYPNNLNRKAAQLIDISWFNSVVLLKLDGHSRLMHFLEVTLPVWLSTRGPQVVPERSLVDNLDAYARSPLLLA